MKNGREDDPLVWLAQSGGATPNQVRLLRIGLALKRAGEAIDSDNMAEQAEKVARVVTGEMTDILLDLDERVRKLELQVPRG
jgi:hypothetical protein